MPAAPDRFLSPLILRQLAGEQLFASGEQCFARGRVRQIRTGKDRVSARVAGERTYRVKLWRRRGELQFQCDCDDGRTETFCQHCVAVGLAWLSNPENAGRPGPGGAEGGTGTKQQENARREGERQQVSAYLRTMDQERLASLVLEATDFDEILRRRLLLEATGIAPPPGSRGSRGARKSSRARPEAAVYRQLLREAIQPPGTVDYHSMPDYVQGIEEAIAPLAEWLRRGWHEEVVGLVEFVLVEMDAASDRADLGDPILNRVYDHLQQYHLDACRNAKPHGKELAARLLHYELEGGLGIFNNAVKTYGDILGAEGRSAWRSLLIGEWRKLTAGEGSAPPPPIDHRRFQIQLLMEHLASAEGDADALLALKCADLRGVRDYVNVAEWLDHAGRLGEAIACAERAAKRFPLPHDRPVWRDFLLTAYPRAGRRDAALLLAWEQFDEAPDLERYRALKSLVLASEAASWPGWRDRALARTREQTGKARRRAGNAPSTARPDDSLLVEVFLEEELAEDAWRAAVAGGCHPELWLRLAGLRERDHPDEAMEVYRRQIDRAIAAGGPSGYGEAVELLTRARALSLRSQQDQEHARYVAALRSTHRQRRAFLRLLVAAGI